MRLPLSLVVTALVVGCATLPELHPWFAASDSGKTPTVVGARGPLSTAQVATVLARLKATSGESDLLARHIAIEEEAAGTPLTVGNQATLLRDGPATYKAMFD